MAALEGDSAKLKDMAQGAKAAVADCLSCINVYDFLGLEEFGAKADAILQDAQVAFSQWIPINGNLREILQRIAEAPALVSSLLTTHLLTTHYSLFTIYYLLLTTYYLLLTTHYSLLTTYYLLLTTHYLLHTSY
jgi:hypothetical protein